MNTRKILIFLSIIWMAGIIFLPSYLFSQKTKANPYGLKIISDTLEYYQLIHADSNQKMVDLVVYIPGINLDIRYATKNNFTGKIIYDSPRAFLCLPVAKALKEIQSELQPQGLGLKIFDAYRPYAATLLFYETIRDTVFVAAPWKGSRHNRGCAIDVSVINLQTGEEIEMPTPYDEFSDRAHPDYNDLPKKAIINRGFLIRTMQKHGFTVYPDEWWHFDFMGYEKHPLLDLPFEWLDQMNNRVSVK